ncbi:hypothetical protein TUM4438_16590 [Shewanella sairae]|uniref:DUF3861 domain-containing protein n=1 Tax=Shewanella sairae TaxID=190310 RepID=A0ABQ4PC65_9GAMM|nr:DUF3861 domain-containing protein [Shewanella sairae]MCL1130198.1 DUF3861 domain-containing protein [Shewanella sairae]GIU44726.1 hypothetical protein TUM4438_16590 [Shewanella sairae]
MKGHLYKVTLEHIEDAKGLPIDDNSLQFEARNHDDIFKIVEMIKIKMDLEEADAVAFAVGLKLFGEVMLKNRDVELFKQFKPHMTDFMKQLKKL